MYTCSNDWKRGQPKKICVDLLRFASILFLIFEKEDQQKIVLGCFKICKYTFFNIWQKAQVKKLG